MPLADILVTLHEHRVDFILVGGMAAVLRGAPVVTRDIDVVYALDEANVLRALSAVEALDARFRNDPRNLRPNASHLRSRGHKLLETRCGPLDLLGTIEEDTTYDELLPHATPMEVAGVPVLVLGLDRLIEVKRKLSRPKDKLMLLQLESLREELGHRLDRG